MPRSQARRFAIALMVFITSASVFGQDVGSQVVARRSVDLKIRDEVKATVGPTDLLLVEKVQDDWLWVKTLTDQRGWVLKEDVKPAPNPSATPRANSGAAPAAPEGDAAVDDRLYLIGAMGATQVYLTYAYIGAIGDGYVKQTFDAKKVQELMNEVDGMGTHLVTHLTQVRDGELTDKDREAIDQMIDINEDLRKYAQSLSAYSASPTPDNAKSFEEIRTRVWPKISDLLGIQPGSELPGTKSETQPQP